MYALACALAASAALAQPTEQPRTGSMPPFVSVEQEATDDEPASEEAVEAQASEDADAFLDSDRRENRIRQALEAEPSAPAVPPAQTASPEIDGMAAGPLDPAPAPLAQPDQPAAVEAVPSGAPKEVEATQRQVVEELEAERSTLEAIEDEAAAAAETLDLPDPCTGPWDWVQYSSGEWLRGEFKRMRKKSFEFQSTRFDRRTTDWKHVRSFCFPGNTRFILYDHTVLAGEGRLENGVLTVVSGEIAQTARRSDIWVMLPGLPKEINRWRSTVSVGLDTYTGNTDQSAVTSSASLDREDPTSHLHLEYTGSFSSVDGETTAARHRAGQVLNVYFTRIFYASLPFVDYTSDRFQNLQHRVVPGLSLGVKIFDLNDFEWSVDGGLAYQYTQYVSLAGNANVRENDWGPRLATSLEWDIVTDLTLTIDQQSVLLVRNFGQTNFHTRASLVYDITDLLYIELGIWHDRTRDPREDDDGVTPKKDDVRYVFSLGLSFD